MLHALDHIGFCSQRRWIGPHCPSERWSFSTGRNQGAEGQFGFAMTAHTRPGMKELFLLDTVKKLDSGLADDYSNSESRAGFSKALLESHQGASEPHDQVLQQTINTLHTPK